MRGARIANEQIRKENSQEIDWAIAENRHVDHAKMQPIWQDDLRDRVRIAAMGAWDEDSFARRLRANDVELILHENRKTGTLSYVHPATRKQPAHYGSTDLIAQR